LASPQLALSVTSQPVYHKVSARPGQT
jgi:hypothetical protein